LAALVARALVAEIAIEGVTDRQVLTDRVTFRILTVPDAEDAAELNGAPVPTDTWVRVSRPDYYELRVERRTSAGVEEGRRLQFIVRAAERGSTERGLPPWTPYPVMASGPEEFEGAHLRLVAPQSYPIGLEIPLAIWLEDEAGRAVRANGWLRGEGHPPLALRRGVGSGFVAAPRDPGPLVYTGAIAALTASRTIHVEADPDWLPVAGTMPGHTLWPEDARIAVTGTITVPAEATLEIGAGTVVRLAAGANVVVAGRVLVGGTLDRPVVFVPASAGESWGGFLLLGAAAELTATGTIFTGSGANPDWFEENPGYNVHRSEQALFLVDEARVSLTDCYAFAHQGQFGHGKDGDLQLVRCLVQQFTTGGEYNGGSVQISHSALIEFPRDDDTFADADNDGIYFTTGNHVLRDSLVGWAKDDGIDHGSGGAGTLLLSNVWVEACYHEAFAWSGAGRVVTNLHCVAINCGQGIECGWSSSADSPAVWAEDCLSLGNLSGARFGDNYDWTYNGRLRVTNSFLLYNYRDVFSLNWDDWTPRLDQVEVRGNFLSRPDPNHPENAVWQPAQDGWRLASFLTIPPAARVGLGLATRTVQGEFSKLALGLPVGLSSFTTNAVWVDYTVETQDSTLATGTLDFSPGQTVQRVPLPAAPPDGARFVRVQLSNPQNAVFTGSTVYHFLRGATTLIPTGSVWRYRDDGSDQGTAWRAVEFDASGWRSGPAELGFGDGDEATVVQGGPESARHATIYFRHEFSVSAPEQFARLQVHLRRDDGALVYLNGTEVFRSNLPDGAIAFATYTGVTTSSETAFYSTNVPVSLLESGRNVVAVEVHQASATSSDLSFELELIGVPRPRLEWAPTDRGLLLLWVDPTLTIETAAELTDGWVPVVGATSPVRVAPPAAAFYRLQRDE